MDADTRCHYCGREFSTYVWQGHTCTRYRSVIVPGGRGRPPRSLRCCPACAAAMRTDADTAGLPLFAPASLITKGQNDE